MMKRGLPQSGHPIPPRRRPPGGRPDRIVPDWLGWLAVGAALLLTVIVAYFMHG